MVPNITENTKIYTSTGNEILNETIGSWFDTLENANSCRIVSGDITRFIVVNEMIEDGTLEADGKISEDEFVKALFVNNVTIFVNGSETGFYIDLDAEPDYFMGHLVCIEVDCKYKIEVGGFNG